MLYPLRILCSVFAPSLFLIFFNNRVYGLWSCGSQSIFLLMFADPLDLCMNRGMRIKNENVLSLPFK